MFHCPKNQQASSHSQPAERDCVLRCRISVIDAYMLGSRGRRNSGLLD